MTRQRFPLTTDQLELLLAFEKSHGLAELSNAMAKDPSVISRNLQRLAEDYPVIIKVHGRWQVTPLGLKVNRKSESFLSDLEVDLENANKVMPHDPFERTILIVINAQKGLSDPIMGERCNNNAEDNIRRLLDYWRLGKRPIIHVKHVSKNPNSVFFEKAKGVEFISQLSPQDGELVVEKTKASAFFETPLLEHLNQISAEQLIITGFTANECIDVTARNANELGFSTFVVEDATASFDFFGHDGKLYKADRIHHLVLANLHVLSSKVIDTNEALGRRSSR